MHFLWLFPVRSAVMGQACPACEHPDDASAPTMILAVPAATQKTNQWRYTMSAVERLRRRALQTARLLATVHIFLKNPQLAPDEPQISPRWLALTRVGRIGSHLLNIFSLGNARSRYRLEPGRCPYHRPRAGRPVPTAAGMRRREIGVRRRRRPKPFAIGAYGRERVAATASRNSPPSYVNRGCVCRPARSRPGCSRPIMLHCSTGSSQSATPSSR